MADTLLPYLERLLVEIDKDKARFEQKSKDALFMKPIQQWTDAEHKRYARTSTDKMLEESEKWMQRQIDADFAARDLRNLIFVRGLSRGR